MADASALKLGSSRCTKKSSALPIANQRLSVDRESLANFTRHIIGFLSKNAKRHKSPKPSIRSMAILQSCSTSSQTPAELAGKVVRLLLPPWPVDSEKGSEQNNIFTN